MILVDTSVWVDHLRHADPKLSEILNGGLVLMHPFVMGELALGSLKKRSAVLDALQGLPQVNVATDAEVMYLIEQNALYGIGIGYVDAHLLAAARLTNGCALWTRDQRLQAASIQFNLAVNFHH